MESTTLGRQKVELTMAHERREMSEEHERSTLERHEKTEASALGSRKTSQVDRNLVHEASQ